MKVIYSCRQSKSSNLITWEWEFLWKFWLQIRNQRPQNCSKKVSPYFSHAFLGWPNFWAFSTYVMHLKVSHISCIWINSVQFVTLSKYICGKRNQGPILSFSGRPWLEKGLPTWQFWQNSHCRREISDEYFGKILMGSNRVNKKETIGIFFIFLAIFSGSGQNFGVKNA